MVRRPITHDGVTVAKDIELENPYANMGAQLVKEASTKTNDIAGDGTTTSVVLAQAIVNEGLKVVAAGANPMLLKRGIEKGTELVVEEIKKLAKPINGKEDVTHIATISGGDPEIGDLALRSDGQSRQRRRYHRRRIQDRIGFRSGLRRRDAV